MKPTTTNASRTSSPISVIPGGGFSGPNGSSVAVTIHSAGFIAQAELVEMTRRAVNSHAALVAALEESADLLRAARLRLGMADAVGILTAWQADAAKVESAARAALAAARND